VLPLHPGMELDVREHAFLLASHHIAYSYVASRSAQYSLCGQGMFNGSVFTTSQPGLLLLHGLW